MSVNRDMQLHKKILLSLVLFVLSLVLFVASQPAPAQDGLPNTASPAHHDNHRGAESVNDSENLTPELAKSIVQMPRFSAPDGWKWGYFINGDGARLRYGYCTAKDAGAASSKITGTIVILPGFTEFGEVYFELAKDFLQRGYSVYELDWRGAGGSDRYFKKNQKSSSLGIDHDVDDLRQFLQAIVLKKSTHPVFLIAHSLGSHITLRYLHDYPQSVDGAVLSAPPLSLGFGATPPWVVQMETAFQMRLKHGNDYLPGQGDWEILSAKASHMKSHSHDPMRVKLEYAWDNQNPSLQVGGMTWRSVEQFDRSCQLLQTADFVREITTPILIGCPTSDHIANPLQMRSLAENLLHATLFEVPDARHDLFLEDDAHRNPWMDAVFKFIYKASKPNTKQIK